MLALFPKTPYFGLINLCKRGLYRCRCAPLCSIVLKMSYKIPTAEGLYLKFRQHYLASIIPHHSDVFLVIIICELCSFMDNLSKAIAFNRMPIARLLSSSNETETNTHQHVRSPLSLTKILEKRVFTTKGSILTAISFRHLENVSKQIKRRGQTEIA